MPVLAPVMRMVVIAYVHLEWKFWRYSLDSGEYKYADARGPVLTPD